MALNLTWSSSQSGRSVTTFSLSLLNLIIIAKLERTKTLRVKAITINRMKQTMIYENYPMEEPLNVLANTVTAQTSVKTWPT